MVFRNRRSLTLVEVVWNNKSVMVTAKMEKPVWLVFSTEEKAENPQTGEAKVTKHRLKRKSREVCVYLWHQAKHSAKELAAKSSQTYNQARWFKKEDANTLLKTQMKKSEFFRVANTLGQEKHICMFITVFRPVPFCWHENERNSVLESWAKWECICLLSPIVFVRCWHDPENWHGWRPSECWG